MRLPKDELSLKEIEALKSETPEERLFRQFKESDIMVGGRLVMKAGKVIDEEWWKGKLKHAKKHMRDAE